MQIIKISSQINFLGHLDGINLCLDQFHQCKVTLNTISPRMKSTPRVEVCYPLAAGIEHVIF